MNQRLQFEYEAPVVRSDPNRVDIACFIGFVRRREITVRGLVQLTRVPDSILDWLAERGWSSPPNDRKATESLLDVPVPVDRWELFDALFAWESRTTDARDGSTYLGAAVRSFFAQGGRRCYVVRVGDPWPIQALKSQRLLSIAKLIPGFPSTLTSSPVDQRSWSGVGHIFGLPDVSFLCLPDLASAVASPFTKLPPAPEPPPPPEQFVECSTSTPAPDPAGAAGWAAAPRSNAFGYKIWARAVQVCGDLLRTSTREVQLIAAIPLPVESVPAAHDMLAFLEQWSFGSSDRDADAEVDDTGRKIVRDFPDSIEPAPEVSKSVPGPLARDLSSRTGISSAFIQLVYPWARTPGSANLAEQLESPEGILSGLLARGILTRGSFRSAAGLHLGDLESVYPLLRQDELLPSRIWKKSGLPKRLVLPDRVSILGQTPDGLRLISDVTTSLDADYRPSGVCRLVSVIVRAARRLGEDITFESSGERLWGRIRDRLNSLMQALFDAGAFRGETTEDAFEVVCDRSTMSQNDMDSGRVIALIRFAAAMPIETISILLRMDAGGQVSATSGEIRQENAA